MRCNCAMMSLSDTSLVEEEGADVDGVEQDRAEREGGAAESDCRDRNCASLCLIVAVSMAHITEKWSEEEKGTEKWHKIHMIAEGNELIIGSRIPIHIYKRENKM